MRKSITQFCIVLFTGMILGRDPGTFQPDVTITVNKAILAASDTLNINIVIKGYNLGDVAPPPCPDIPGFIQVDQNSSVLNSVVGGTPYTRRQYVCSYIPRESGIFIIAPIQVQLREMVFKSKPIQIKVLNPDGTENPKFHQPEMSKPSLSQPTIRSEPGTVEQLKMVVEVNTTAPFVGEQVVLTYYLLTNVSVGQNVVELKRPDYKEFWLETVPLDRNAQVEGQSSRVFRIPIERLVLFPIRPGEITIASATWKVIAKISTPKPVEQERYLSTSTLILKVHPIGKKSATSLKKAVGRFDISLNYSSTDIKLGQAFPIYLTIKGKGNIRGLPPPELPSIEAFDVVSIKAVYSKFFEWGLNHNNSLTPAYGGEKVWEIVLYPKQMGQVIFPEIPFSFFDPETVSDQQLRTSPILFLVSKVEGKSSLAEEKNAKPSNQRIPVSVYVIFSFCILLAATAIFMLIALRGKITWQSKSSRKRIFDVNLLFQEAEEIITHKGSSAFYDIILNALVFLLRQTTGMSIQAMTREEVMDVLNRKGFDNEDCEACLNLIAQCDEGRFAGASFDLEQRRQMLDTARRLQEKMKSNFQSKSL